jgi:hypothetical protein
VESFWEGEVGVYIPSMKQTTHDSRMASLVMLMLSLEKLRAYRYVSQRVPPDLSFEDFRRWTGI